MCISRLPYELQRYSLPKSDVLGGAKYAVGASAAKCGNAKCRMHFSHRRIRMRHARLNSRQRSPGRIHDLLLILQETVQCIHLLTPRQRDRTRRVLTEYFVSNTTGEKLTGLHYVSQSRQCFILIKQIVSSRVFRWRIFENF